MSSVESTLQKQLTDLETDALGRIAAAQTAEELESVRIDALGRKGVLAAASKEMGKLPPGERAAIGKQLNAAKQALEAALESKQNQFAAHALLVKLDAEWVELTIPAPGIRPGPAYSAWSRL